MSTYRTLHDMQEAMDRTAKHIERQAEEHPPAKPIMMAVAKGWKDAAAYVRSVMVKEKGET